MVKKKLNPELAELRGDPATFEEAMNELNPKESQFVRHVLAGKTRQQAAALVWPGQKTAVGKRVKGTVVAARARVAHALRLGREAGTLAAITGLAYDVQAADKQIQELIDEARASDQYSAVAQLLKSRLTLHKLDQPQVAQQQGVQIILQSADGVEVKRFGEDAPRTIEAEEGDNSDNGS